MNNLELTAKRYFLSFYVSKRFMKSCANLSADNMISRKIEVFKSRERGEVMVSEMRSSEGTWTKDT